MLPGRLQRLRQRLKLEFRQLLLRRLVPHPRLDLNEFAKHSQDSIDFTHLL